MAHALLSRFRGILYPIARRSVKIGNENFLLAFTNSDAEPSGFRLCVSSQETKKNVRCLPLYNFGIHTGPPKFPPYSLKCTGGTAPPIRFVWNRFAFIALFWLNS